MARRRLSGRLGGGLLRGAVAGRARRASLACALALVSLFTASASGRSSESSSKGDSHLSSDRSHHSGSPPQPTAEIVSSARSQREYRNPILPGSYPDPSIVRVGPDYYLVTSSFEYFPGIPIFHSLDLVHWRQIGHVLTRRSQLPLGTAASSGGVFAPTLRHHQGTFYVITTNVGIGQGKNFFVTASDPAGPWSEPVFVNDEGMDPSLLFLEGQDGQPTRVFYTSQLGSAMTSRIVQAEIDPATGELKSELRTVWQGTGGPWTEGPHLYAIDGRYYVVAAEGGTGAKHSAIVARADQPEGPFYAFPGNPIASHRGHPGAIQSVGHADLVQTATGDWFAVLLGVRTSGTPPTHVLGRESFLAPVAWSNGWPSIGQRGQIAELMRGSLPSAHPWPTPEARDDFAAGKLGLEWNFLRNPPPGAWSLEARPGWLRLRGNSVTLDQPGAPAFVGRRQQHAAFRAATRLDFDPRRPGDEAGLALRMSETHHCEIALTRKGTARFVTLRLRNGNVRRVLARRKISTQGPVTLRVESDGARYAFAYGMDDGTAESLGDISTGVLSSEVAGTLTGVYLALYATGNGEASQQAADFDWFEYAPQ